MPKITSVKCPNCSAPLGTDSNRCEYCGARVEISQDGTKVVLAGVQCPDCGLDNDPAQRFCGACGAALVQTCPSCNETNRVGFQYCGGCGLELREARKQVAAELRQQAIQNGLNRVKSHLKEYQKLYDFLASPDEVIIVFRTGGGDEVQLLEAGRTLSTGFVATDRGFLFLERSRGSQGATARRLPYEKAQSLTVDDSAQALILRFDGGEARLNLRSVAGHAGFLSPRQQASFVVQHFKPFLPLRMQYEW